jgi:hypothetical protein
MIIEIASYVVVSGHPAECVAFDRTIGLPLEDEQHGDGTLHWAVEIGGVHAAVYPADVSGEAPRHRESGRTVVG